MKKDVDDLKEYCVRSSGQSIAIYKFLLESLVDRLKKEPATQHAVLIGLADLLCACANAAGLKKEDLVKSVDLSYTSYLGEDVMARMKEIEHDSAFCKRVTEITEQICDDKVSANAK